MPIWEHNSGSWVVEKFLEDKVMNRMLYTTAMVSAAALILNSTACSSSSPGAAQPQPAVEVSPSVIPITPGIPAVINSTTATTLLRIDAIGQTSSIVTVPVGTVGTINFSVSGTTTIDSFYVALSAPVTGGYLNTVNPLTPVFTWTPVAGQASVLFSVVVRNKAACELVLGVGACAFQAGQTIIPAAYDVVSQVFTLQTSATTTNGVDISALSTATSGLIGQISPLLSAIGLGSLTSSLSSLNNTQLLTLLTSLNGGATAAQTVILANTLLSAVAP